MPKWFNDHMTIVWISGGPRIYIFTIMNDMLIIKDITTMNDNTIIINWIFEHHPGLMIVCYDYHMMTNTNYIYYMTNWLIYLANHIVNSWIYECYDDYNLESQKLYCMDLKPFFCHS